MLLSVHMDSDVLDLEALTSLRFDSSVNAIRHNGDVGLDCKTGIAIVLAVLERLMRSEHAKGIRSRPSSWSVHVLFTVGEESGQKGAFRAPLPELMGGCVRHALAIDRKTSGKNAPLNSNGMPQRHVVTAYKGVQLKDRHCGEELVRLLWSSMNLLPDMQGMPFPEVESPNCSDALELRGRWDAEVVAPALLKESTGDLELKQAVEEYDRATATIRESMETIPPEQRVCSMNQRPRITRYRAMQKVQALLGKRDLRPSHWFSCANLSYDYDEERKCLSLSELEDTCEIILGFVALYFKIGENSAT